jgi:hypothetical protein
MSPRRAVLAAVLLAPLVVAVAPAQGRPATKVQRVHFTTVPVVKGLKLRFPGRRFVRTDSRGHASIRLKVMLRPGLRASSYRQLKGGYFYPAPRVRPLKRSDGSRVSFSRLYGTLISVTVTYPFVPRFVREGGKPLPPDAIQSYTLKSRTGRVLTIEGAAPTRLQGSRVVPYSGHFLSKDIEWAVQIVMVDGTNVVTRARNRFSPRKVLAGYEVPLLFYAAKITSKDAVFGNDLGKSVTLTYPSGRKRLVRLSKDGTSNLTGLPRGNFKIKSNAAGLSPERPLALSRDQVVELAVISYLDLALAAALLGALAIALLVARRPHLRRLPGRLRRVRTAQPPEPRPEAEAEPETELADAVST